MTTYEVLTCNICAKSINRIINTSHISINKCNLTKNCKGTLHNVLQVENPVTMQQTNDWESRFLESTVQESAAKKISLLSGNNNISFAVLRTGFLSENYPLSFDATTTQTIESIEYVYIKPSGTRYLNGFDSTPNKRFLVYNITTHDVAVYLNNVLLTENQYDRSVVNQIRLDFPTVLFTNTIRIIVSKKIVVQNVDINVNNSYSLDNTSCFSGIKSLCIFNGVNTVKNYDVYHLNNVSGSLLPNTLYKFKNITSEIYMLIGDNTRKSNDRILSHAVPITNGFSFVYDGDILVDYSYLLELYPQFNILEYYNSNHTYTETQQYSNTIIKTNTI